MRRAKLLGVGLLCGTLFGSSGAGDSAGGFTVTPRITWTSSAKPEINLLIRNKTAAPAQYSVSIGSERGQRGANCESRAPDPALARRFNQWDSVSRAFSVGRLEAGGWAHRSVALGTAGLTPPCDVPYTVRFFPGELREVSITGWVEVPSEAPRASGNWGRPAIETDAVVERDVDQANRALVRLLVINSGAKSTRVLVTARRVLCAEGGHAELALHHGVLQGQDSGPFDMAKDEWAVFVFSLETGRALESDACKLEVVISAEWDAKTQPVTTVEIPLQESVNLFGSSFPE